MNPRRDLYPPIDPFRVGTLTLDARHAMYWEESGSPHGAPVLFLHGGPGAGATPVHRRFFDPDHWRIVIFDQRGAGRSTPLGEVEDNTPAHLVADIERLRIQLGIEKSLVFGGSWGSTLAPDYAAPPRCAGYFAWDFLCRGRRSTGFFTVRAGSFPKLGARFRVLTEGRTRRSARLLPPPARSDPCTCRQRAWASEVLIRHCRPGTVAAFGGQARGSKTDQAHYFSHHLFAGDRDLIARIGQIRHIPGVIVQGRYDMVCPIRSADELARAWPEAEYVIVPDAGHSAMEPGIRAQLVLATERMKRA
jgi:proline iminopeptidase